MWTKFRLWLARNIMPGGWEIVTSPGNHCSLRRKISLKMWQKMLNKPVPQTQEDQEKLKLNLSKARKIDQLSQHCQDQIWKSFDDAFQQIDDTFKQMSRHRK